MELVTKKDLQEFKKDLITEISEILSISKKETEVKWLKSTAIRKILNVSHGTLQNLRITGVLHPRKIGGSYYYSLKEVTDLFARKGEER